MNTGGGTQVAHVWQHPDKRPAVFFLFLPRHMMFVLRLVPLKAERVGVSHKSFSPLSVGWKHNTDFQQPIKPEFEC